MANCIFSPIVTESFLLSDLETVQPGPDGFSNFFICLSHHLFFLLSGIIPLHKKVWGWMSWTIEEFQDCLQFLKHMNALLFLDGFVLLS